jgi:hypothetical protein
MRQRVGGSKYWDEPLPTGILPPPEKTLDLPVDELWSMFSAIKKHWHLKEPQNIELLRSRWLDMLEARSSGAPDYRGEYVNAGCVFAALKKELGGEDNAIAMLYGRTLVTDEEQATTRLAHAKYYVANDFIRCFVATGGFRGFVEDARNYTGFMGGSRFREWPPVRTGKRK